ncbi:UNVERIFIED_CONTAM: multicomponent Na+:H+ antiporter subunit B [Acetivibrio alkalicellulosi]
MRRIIIFIIMSFIFTVFMFIYKDSIVVFPNQVSDYIKSNFIIDTGARNAVTSIYLNYRVYDTFFETLTLLVSIIGVIHFSKHEGEL